MDSWLELKRQYEGLTDDEIMRVCADQEGLTEAALSVLSEEMTRRKLLNDPQNYSRIEELKQGLIENTKGERARRGMVLRAKALALVLAAGVLVLAFNGIAALVAPLFSKAH